MQTMTVGGSVDVECNRTADMFSIMRAAYTLQRALTG
jgi:cytosine/adenosine deaminase-related metal-dependent hydrolase